MDRVLVLINEMPSWGQSAKTGKFFYREIAAGAIAARNPCVQSAHRQLSTESVDPLIANTFEGLDYLPKIPKYGSSD